MEGQPFLGVVKIDSGELHDARLTADLKACMNGGAPCLMNDGSVEVPGLAERRRETRWTVNWRAVLLLGPDESEAIVRDISRSGIGLKTGIALSRGESITFCLSSTRVLRGAVMWVDRDLYGIRLNIPLEADDDIILAAQAGKSRAAPHF